MRSIKRNLGTLTFLTCLISARAPGATFSFPIYETFSPIDSSVITNIEQITTPGGGQSYASISQSSSPCNELDAAGCTVANFTAALPQMVLPADQYVTSATLNLYLLTIMSRTEGPTYAVSIDPTKPYSSTPRGVLFQGTNVVFGTSAGYLYAQSPNGLTSFVTADYTSAVKAALSSSSGNLTPIVGEDRFYYFDKGGSSIVPLGTNSTTTYTTLFGRYATVNFTALITVNTEQIPEVNTAFLLGTGLIGLLGMYLRRRD